MQNKQAAGGVDVSHTKVVERRWVDGKVGYYLVRCNQASASEGVDPNSRQILVTDKELSGGSVCVCLCAVKNRMKGK